MILRITNVGSWNKNKNISMSVVCLCVCIREKRKKEGIIINMMKKKSIRYERHTEEEPKGEGEAKVTWFIQSNVKHWDVVFFSRDQRLTTT